MKYLKIFIKFIIKNTFLKKYIVEISNFLLIPKNIFRYYGLIKIDYKLDKKINFGSKKANNFFLNKIKKSKKYFEYGAGNSTLAAKKYSNLYLSVESDDHFGKFCIEEYNLKILIKNFGPVTFYSWPILKFFRKKNLTTKVKNYTSAIKHFIRKNGCPDLILIDGRCRVFCALMVHNSLMKYQKKKITVIIDDFKFRKHYSEIRSFFYIKTVGRLGVINKIKRINTNNLIQKYKYDFR